MEKAQFLKWVTQTAILVYPPAPIRIWQHLHYNQITVVGVFDDADGTVHLNRSNYSRLVPIAQSSSLWV